MLNKRLKDWQIQFYSINICCSKICGIWYELTISIVSVMIWSSTKKSKNVLLSPRNLLVSIHYFIKSLCYHRITTVWRDKCWVQGFVLSPWTHGPMDHLIDCYRSYPWIVHGLWRSEDLWIRSQKRFILPGFFMQGISISSFAFLQNSLSNSRCLNLV